MKREIIAELREKFPVGIRVELVRMDDSQAPLIGTKGTVRGVDDIGSIMVRWDNGSTLNVVYGEDACKVITTIPSKVVAQILKIRETGLTNMFDTNMVQRLAYDRGYYELVDYLVDHRKEYSHFIMTGE